MKIGLGELSKEYWKYWIASAVSMSASNILQFILSLYVLDITGSATLFASMLSIIVIPRIVLTPIAGVISDRIEKNKIMSLVLFIDFLLMLLTALLTAGYGLHLFAIYIIVFVLEIGEVFYNSASAAIMPELVDDDKIKDAVAISKIDDGIVVVACPMVAALIYSQMVLWKGFLVVAVLDLLSCLVQKSIRLKRAVCIKQKTDELQESKLSFMGEFKEGLSYIKSDNFLSVFVKVLPVINAFFGATFSVSIMYLLRERFEISEMAYGAYNSVTAFTSLIVPFAAVYIVRKYKVSDIFVLSTILIAIEILGIGGISYLALNGIISVIIAIIFITILDCMTIAEAIPMQIASSVMLQTEVDRKVLGRVSSLIKMVSVVAVATGEFVMGILNDNVGIVPSIMIGALGVGTASLFFCLCRPHIRERQEIE